MHERIGSTRSRQQADEIAEPLSKARALLTDDEWAAAHERLAAGPHWKTC